MPEPSLFGLTFNDANGRPWAGIVDVVSGGFCANISIAGKGKGLDGERLDFGEEMARIICDVRPRFVFVVYPVMLTLRGLGAVLGDHAALGRLMHGGKCWETCALGAPHGRERIWIAAYADPDFVRAPWTFQTQRRAADLHKHGIGEAGQVGSWWEVQPEAMQRGLWHGRRVDQLAIRQWTIPSVAATACGF